MQTLTILGATGSIGLSTLDVIARHPAQFKLFAVTGNTNVEGMVRICQKYQPKVVVMVVLGIEVVNTVVGSFKIKER